MTDNRTDPLTDARLEYDAAMREIGGCSDGYCLVTGPAKGMHTNGGCRCWMDKLTAQRAMRAAARLRNALEKIR